MKSDTGMFPKYTFIIVISSVQLLSHVWFFAAPWTAACKASLSITNSRSLLRLMSIESVMPSNDLILCHPLLLPLSIFPSIRVFSNESVLHIRWPKYYHLQKPGDSAGLRAARSSSDCLGGNKEILVSDCIGLFFILLCTGWQADC